MSGDIDMVLVVDGADHPAYRNPSGIVCTLWQSDALRVRSVTVLDRTTGLTSIYRDGEAW